MRLIALRTILRAWLLLRHDERPPGDGLLVPALENILFSKAAAPCILHRFTSKPSPGVPMDRRSLR